MANKLDAVVCYLTGMHFARLFARKKQCNLEINSKEFIAEMEYLAFE